MSSATTHSQNGRASFVSFDARTSEHKILFTEIFTAVFLQFPLLNTEYSLVYLGKNELEEDMVRCCIEELVINNVSSDDKALDCRLWAKFQLSKLFIYYQLALG